MPQNPNITFTGAVQCVGSEIAIDPKPGLLEAVCPACGAMLPVGGTRLRPRLPIHNTTGVEPCGREWVGDHHCGLPAGHTGTHLCGCRAEFCDGDMFQRAIDEADAHMEMARR